MLTVDRIHASVERLRVSQVLHNSVQRRVAFGILDVAAETPEAWVVILFVDDVVSEVEVHFIEDAIDAEERFQADITVSAVSQVWLEIGGGGVPAAILACDARKISIGGKLPYFIRNVRSSIDLIVLFGQELAK